MKALVLAGGRGNRINELSSERNKCMINLGGIPVLEYSLRRAAEAGVEEIVIVVGYRAEEIINTFGNRYMDKPVKYVIQWEQKGLVHAMECAKETIAGSDFVLFLGDELMVNPRHRQMLDEFNADGVFALCGVLWVDNAELIKRTYTMIKDDERRIYRLVEKPRHPLNNFMGTGSCVFKNEIFDYAAVTPIHHQRKEKELPDLIQCAIDDGKTVKSFEICDQYANINSFDDFSEAEGFIVT
ncbi:MAG: nucleotidyltransferase family protein [Candidatus Magnetominusculus sp. LBB02]|nr:nucleotidyltransferase family protein [Candidatus Magnetominusculus sp. LBB02]